MNFLCWLLCIFLPCRTSFATNDYKLFSAFKSTIKALINDSILYLKSNNISDTCFNDLKRSWVDDTELVNGNIEKLLFDSSKNKNDVIKYSSCMKPVLVNNKVNSNSTFIVITSNDVLDKGFRNQTSFIYGLCFPQTHCNETEYLSLFLYINKLHPEIISNPSQASVSWFEVNETQTKFKFSSTHIINFLPVLVFALQFVFTLCTGIPYVIFSFLYKCCSKSRTSNTKDNLNISSADNSWMNFTPSRTNNSVSYYGNTSQHRHIPNNDGEIRKAFNWKQNSEQYLHTESNNMHVSTESGLTYIKGIKGFSVWLFILGNTFTILNRSPCQVYSEIMFSDLMKNYFFGFVFNGIRYAPRILLSCSGYILCFKLMCFLDDKVDEEIDRNEDKMKIAKWKEDTSEENDLNCDVKIGHLITFIVYQLHKYIFYIFAIVFVRYTIYYFHFFSSSISPVWEYFYQKIITSTSTTDFLWSVFLIKPFMFISPAPTEANVNEGILIEYFWWIYNEIIFFIFTAFVIFWCYQKRFSLNNFIYIVNTILIVARLILIFVIDDYNSTHYFSSLKFGKFFISPLYNYTYYLIGVYFGLINYAMQKGWTLNEVTEDERYYLVSPIISLKYFNQKSRAFFNMNTAIFLSVFVVFCVSQQWYLHWINASLASFNSNWFFRVFYIVDIDLIVLGLHWVMLGLYAKGDNIISKIISNNIWFGLHKLYYSFVLSWTPITLYFMFHSDTRINPTFGNVLVYSVMIGICNYIFALFFYIVFELPYKRWIKFFFNNQHGATAWINNEDEKDEVVFSANPTEDDSKIS